MKQWLGLKSGLKTMCVVLDTNVLISAFLWQKNLKPIYQAVKQKKITPCFNQATWQELNRALSYKKFAEQFAKIDISKEEITQLISEHAHFSPGRADVEIVKDDPSDNNQLACAQSAQACFIVSGDKHLLQIKKFRQAPIISPKGFIKVLKFLKITNNTDAK